jgi:hypothetical protein
LELPVVVGRSIGRTKRELENPVLLRHVGSDGLGVLVAIGMIVRVRRIRDKMSAPL